MECQPQNMLFYNLSHFLTHRSVRLKIRKMLIGPELYYFGTTTKNRIVSLIPFFLKLTQVFTNKNVKMLLCGSMQSSCLFSTGI